MHPGPQWSRQISFVATLYGLSQAGLWPRDRWLRRHHRSLRRGTGSHSQEGDNGLPKRALFDSLSVWENVAFPLRERENLDEEEIGRRVDRLLEMVGAIHIRDLLPSEDSTGLKRSVAIARALAANPEAVLYDDEPTTMVDPIMARRLGDLIVTLKTQLKLTSLVVTHEMRLAEKLADHIIFLDRARVIFSGTVAEMERSSEPVVRNFLELDRFDMRALLSRKEPDYRIVA